jgi:hypothetical protein
MCPPFVVVALMPPGTHLWQSGRMINSGYYAGWGTLSLINAGLAQGKNRGGLNWFLLSLLLGPIATFLIVVLKPADVRR